MKLLAAALAPASSFFVSLADASILRLRGGGSNHTKIEQMHDTRGENCDGACSFFPDHCTIDMSEMGLECSGCPDCQTAPASQAVSTQTAKEGVKIRYRTRRYSGGHRLNIEDTQDFVRRIHESQSASGYCDQDLIEASWKNEHTCPGGQIRDVAFQVTVEFDNHIGSNWHFNFGVDFGLGGVIYMDGHLQRQYAGDIWWSMNEQHANELGFGTFVPQGRHNLTVYGAEGCCDGSSRIKFCANCETPENMEVLSVDNVNKAVDHFMELGSFKSDEIEQFHAFSAEFETRPVVVVKGGASGSIQVVDVTATGFSTKGSTSDTEVAYLAVEPGSHILPDGRMMSAGETKWAHPYPANHIMSVGRDYGLSTPALEVTWVGTHLEFAPPGVTSQISPKEASLTAATGQSQTVQNRTAGPAVEWSPNVDLSVSQPCDTLGYVAMARGQGEFKAKGGKTVKYYSMNNIFNFTEASFVV